MKYVQMLLAVGFVAGALGPACAADITGAGATFPYPSYAKWADAYKKETGIGAQALKFFTWAYTNGGTMAEELDYVPMPPKVVDAIEKSWLDIKDASGKPVFAAP
jgi:ABC-type phosphate transport system substrate-binding protein